MAQFTVCAKCCAVWLSGSCPLASNRMPFLGLRINEYLTDNPRSKRYLLGGIYPSPHFLSVRLAKQALSNPPSSSVRYSSMMLHNLGYCQGCVECRTSGSLHRLRIRVGVDVPVTVTRISCNAFILSYRLSRNCCFLMRISHSESNEEAANLPKNFRIGINNHRTVNHTLKNQNLILELKTVTDIPGRVYMG